MGLLERLGIRQHESVCKGQHLFGEYEETGEIRVSERYDIYHLDEDGNVVEFGDSVEDEKFYPVMKKEQVTCKLSECYETNEMWRQVGHVRESDLIEMAEESVLPK